MSEARKKNIQILTIIFAVLVLLALYSKFLSPQKLKEFSYKKKLLEKINKDKITSITISDKLDSFSLEKKDNVWFVKYKDKYLPSSEIKVKAYLDLLTKLPKGITVDKGEDKEKYIKYGLDDERAIKVEIKTSNNITDYIIVGGVGSNQNSSYVRYRDEKIVRETNFPIATETNNSATQWANKKVFPDIKTEDIEKIEVSGYNFSWFKGKYTLTPIKKDKTDEKTEVKDEYEITPQPKGKIKDYQLKNIVTNIIFLYAYDFKLAGSIDKKEKMGEVKVYLKNGSTFSMNIYPKDKEDVADFIAAVDFNNYLYLVTEDSLKYFMKSPEEMVEKSN